MSELRMPDEWAPELDWKAIAQDYEGQVAYLLRRCLAAEGNGDDPAAMEALIADAEDMSRL